MKNKVMIWLAHPEQGSFCEELANAYESGARENGAEVRMIKLAKMKFDANLNAGYRTDRPDLEPDLISWQQTISWANHIVVIHPYWWAGMPGKAKAVLDRAITPGFAFSYRNEKKLSWDKLLKGKTGEGIITSDTPPILDTLLFWRPGRRVLKNMILGFCGIKVKRIVQFGSIRTSTKEKRNKWIKKAYDMGHRAT